MVLAFHSPILWAAGYDVYTSRLTGLGASSHLLHELDKISLDTHVKDITNMIFHEDLSDVILVGHSYGGIVITAITKWASGNSSSNSRQGACIQKWKDEKIVTVGYACISFKFRR